MSKKIPSERAPAVDQALVEARKTFPGLRCIMGNWVFYITYMKFSDVAAWVKPTKKVHEIYDSKELREFIQREIVEERLDDIVRYLRDNDNRFFNAIVIGLYEGAPRWYPIEVGQSAIPDAPTLDEDGQKSIGLLALTGEEVLFAIDGQHRVEAIRKALVDEPDLKDQDLAVLFVSHGENPDRKRRTRRLFSTLNKHAKRVSPGEIIALDEDDAFAITTRRLVEHFDLLRSGFQDKSGLVFFGKQAPLPSSNRQHLTSIITLYNISKTLYVPFGSAQVKAKLSDRNHSVALKRLLYQRPTEAELDKIYEQQTKFWGRLKKKVSPYRKLFDSEPGQGVAGVYRLEEGHLLFRPKGQVAFARAARALMDRGKTLYQAVDALTRVPMSMAGKPWRNTLWEAGTGKMKKGVSDVFLESLFLYMVGEPPRSRAYSNLEQRYQQILDDSNAELPEPIG